MKVITGKELRAIGWKENASLGKALALINQSEAAVSLETLQQLYIVPEDYLTDDNYKEIAAMLIAFEEETKSDIIALCDAQVPYNMYGAAHIDAGARKQMDIAMRLPIARAKNWGITPPLRCMNASTIATANPTLP